MNLLNNRLLRSCLLTSLPLLLFAQAKPSSAVLVKAEDVCAKANEGKRLMIEGYVRNFTGHNASFPGLAIIYPSIGWEWKDREPPPGTEFGSCLRRPRSGIRLIVVTATQRDEY